jgi:spermidine/putrescine transport system substrate-binding protein
MRHPRERSSGLDRRTFLQRSAAWGALASASGLLAACGGGGDGGSTSAGGSGLKLASPSNPETLPISDDNPPIDSGLEPEAGPLKIYNWSEYIWPRVVKDFAEEYGVDFEITSFYNMSEAVNKLRTGQVDFDVFFPTADQVPKLVAAKLLQPLNHDYLKNLNANIWPELADPWYDKGSHYTVPYTVYTTGIAWRKDMVSEDVAGLDNPYEILWDKKYAGKVGIYDDYREAMTMVMLKNGVDDINTADPKILEQVKKELIELSDAVNVKTTIDGAYSRLPEGIFAVHQSWSGDIVAGPYYMPGKSYGDPDGVLQYWWPSDGTIGNDMIAIPAGAKNPVLAHHFLNFLLENKYALKNFSWVGYQPPLQSIEPAKLISDGYVVENLKPAVVEKSNFDTGVIQTALPPEVDRLYQDAWSDFKSGA